MPRGEYNWEPDARFRDLAATIAYKVAQPETLSPDDRPIIECAHRFVKDAYNASKALRRGDVLTRRSDRDAYFIALSSCANPIELRAALGSSLNLLGDMRKSQVLGATSEFTRTGNFFLRIARKIESEIK